MLVPLRDLLYIIPLEPPQRSTIIDTSVRDWTKPTQGIVKYRGPRTSGEIKVGDHVCFAGWDGDVLVIEGEGELLIMEESRIRSRINDDPPKQYLVDMEKVRKALVQSTRELMQQVRPEDQGLLQRLSDRLASQLRDTFNKDTYF